MRRTNVRKKITHNRHHRKARSLGGTNHPDNISVVPERKHAAYHLLFNEGNIAHVVKVLNSTWIDPEYELVIKRKEVS